MKRVLSFIMIAILLIAGIGMVLLYNIGDRFLNELIKDDMIKKEADSTPGTGAKPPEASGTENTPKMQDNPAEGTGKTTAPNNGSGGTKPPQPGETAGKPNPTPEKTADNTGNPQSQQESLPPATEAPDKKQNIPEETIAEIKDQITFSDRMAAAALVMKRLSPSDISTLTQLAAGDITREKMEQGKQLIYSRFTPEEVQQIKDLYYKYIK